MSLYGIGRVSSGGRLLNVFSAAWRSCRDRRSDELFDASSSFPSLAVALIGAFVSAGLGGDVRPPGLRVERPGRHRKGSERIAPRPPQFRGGDAATSRARMDDRGGLPCPLARFFIVGHSPVLFLTSGKIFVTSFLSRSGWRYR